MMRRAQDAWCDKRAPAQGLYFDTRSLALHRAVRRGGGWRRGFAIVRRVMDLDFVWLWPQALAAAATAVVVTIFLGSSAPSGFSVGNPHPICAIVIKTP